MMRGSPGLERAPDGEYADPDGWGVGPRRRALGLFAIAAGTLLSEVTWTRLLSASHLHVFAFLAVSTALLGAGLSARWVAAWPAPAGRGSDNRAAWAALLFAGLVPCAHLAAQATGFDPFALRTGAGWLGLGAVYLALAAPFAASGLTIAEVLERNAALAPRLYAADLAGAAIGSLAALALIPALDGTGALLAASALGCLAGAALMPAKPRRRGGRAGRAGRVLGIPLSSLACLAAAGFFAVGSLTLRLPLYFAKSKTTGTGEPFARLLEDPARHLSTAWTAHARVDHLRFSPSSERLVLDAGAAAVRVPTSPLARSPSDATLPYELRPGARVLVIGSGAGWELAEAVAFDATRAVGVEVNPAVHAHVPAFLTADPRVEAVLDDARSYLERPGMTFDVVVMIHTISNAATAAGALSLTEDHLLTVQAFERVLERLEPEGLLFVTRPEDQLPRLLATLRAASPEGPLDSRVAVWRESQGEFYGAILLARRPLDSRERALLTERLRTRGLVPLHLPGQEPGSDLVGRIVRGEPLPLLSATSGLRLEPASDEAPFFNRRLPLVRLQAAPALAARPGSARLALETRPLAELALLALLLESVLVGLVVFLVPLPDRAGRPVARGLEPSPTSALPQARRSGASSTLRSSARARGFAALLGFSAIGAGFMLVEIAVIQRLGLLLGAPTRAMAISLGGVLLGAGLGSRLAEGARAPPRAVFAAGAALVLAIAGEGLVHALLGSPLMVRMALGGGVAIALGAAIGGVFPAGLVGLVGLPAGFVARAYAVNAVSSVAGTSVALLLAPEIGLTGLALFAAALYASAALLFSAAPRSPPAMPRPDMAQSADKPSGFL